MPTDIFQGEGHLKSDDEEETSNGAEEVCAPSLSLSLSSCVVPFRPHMFQRLCATNYLVTVTSLSPSLLVNSPFCLPKLPYLIQCQFQSEENEETPTEEMRRLII
jgi:hypothetical protein